MAITMVGTPTTGLNTNTVNFITGVTNDDYMWVYQVVYDNTVTLTPPAGWSTYDTQSIAGATATKAAWHYRKANSEPGTPYTFSNSGGAYTDLMQYAYRGVDLTTPIDASATSTTGTSGIPSITGPTTVTANTVLLVALSGYNNDAGGISGMTARVSAFDSVNYLFDQAIAAIGAVGTRTATNTSDGWIMMALALRPAGAGPSSPVGPIIGGKLAGHSILQGRLIG